MPADGLVTTYDEVVAHFVRSTEARRRLAAWRQDPGKSAVVPFVESVETRVLYQQTPESVRAVCRTTEHALGEVKKQVAESIQAIVDWHPAFAFEHVLSHAAETLGAIPTYQAFRTFVSEDPVGRKMLLAPSKRAVSEAEDAGASPIAARASMRWRVGNAYLAHVKQAYVLAVLRDAGIDARYHVLADVLFRVDFWVGETCIALYVGNARYRSAEGGRKVPAEQIVGPSFRHVAISLAARPEFGTVHLPDADETIRQVAAVV